MRQQLQLLTIADLLTGRRIDSPPQSQVSTTFKKASRAAQDVAWSKRCRLISSPEDRRGDEARVGEARLTLRQG